MKRPKKNVSKLSAAPGGRERDPATHSNAHNSFTHKALPKLELRHISASILNNMCFILNNFATWRQFTSGEIIK
jgi:hypothetical protein